MSGSSDNNTTHARQFVAPLVVAQARDINSADFVDLEHRVQIVGHVQSTKMPSTATAGPGQAIQFGSLYFILPTKPQNHDQLNGPANAITVVSEPANVSEDEPAVLQESEIERIQSALSAIGYDFFPHTAGAPHEPGFVLFQPETHPMQTILSLISSANDVFDKMMFAMNEQDFPRYDAQSDDWKEGALTGLLTAVKPALDALIHKVGQEAMETMVKRQAGVRVNVEATQ